jgi:flavin-dependent dehydrogenase
MTEERRCFVEKYDVAVIGGGVAGSVAARYSAEHGFRTLLIERSKTPRNKSCSGIQFVYLEKLLGGQDTPGEALQERALQGRDHHSKGKEASWSDEDVKLLAFDV